MERTSADLWLPAFQETNVKITCSETLPETHFYQIAPHVHTKCEIYVNLSGDISFFCNDHIYPMSRGDVLIARPGDCHHCIYRSNALHRHFWILFDYTENSRIWDTFFTNPFENVLRPSLTEKERIIEICRTLNEKELTDGERFFSFCELMILLKNACSVSCSDHQVPGDFIRVLDYINEHIYCPLTVSELSRECFISASTLERYFLKYTNMRPSQYIRYKKLTEACELLKQGASVSECGAKLGYCDISYFIGLFRKQFGMTPLQYKKLFT